MFIVKFHWHCPLPHDKLQILGMPFKSIYCTFPSYCYEYSVLRHYFPKHLISFLFHAFLCLFLSLCLKCFFNFSSLILFIFFLQAQLKCQILSKVVKPSSAGEIKCYLILLLFGLGCIHSSSNLQQTLKINLVPPHHGLRVPFRPLCVCMLSHSIMPNPFATPWTVTCQAPLSMGLSRWEYWSGLPFPTPGDLPHPVIEPVSPVSCIGRWILYHRATWEAPFLWVN